MKKLEPDKNAELEKLMKTKYPEETNQTLNSNLLWLQDWYTKHCNGDREHSFGICIETIDNPGWHLEIELTDTKIEDLLIPFQLVEVSKTDWYTIEIKEQKYIANGDTRKLDFLIGMFKEIWNR